MSEPILIALVQLFAIVAASKHEKLSKDARLIIETYLKQYLNGNELNEYLLLYDELLLFHEMNSDDGNETNSLESIERICIKIGSGLQQKDKIIIFIKFIEFIKEINNSSSNGSNGDHSESDYFALISSAFNLSDEEFKSIYYFIIDNKIDQLDKSKILAIASYEHKINHQFNTIIRPRLHGYILILHLKSVDILIGRYIGHDDLYLNGHFIYPKHSFILNHGSILRSQKTTPVYYADVAAELLYAQREVKLQFNAQDISYQFKNSKNGIQPISFSAESGELVGVMGGSGTGKSTLLNILNGTIEPAQGDVFINGHSLSEEKEELKSIIGYIPQDDLLIDELTVFQNLYFNAKLCYSNYSDFRLARIILKVLQDVDLMNIRDLVVGNPLNKIISGGQRKRLNIALELLREPSILFADEPTSGLSSIGSEMVMLLLKEQTIKGKLVVVNIHQPSSNIFKLFDKLLILDKGGYPIYYGNPIDSIAYFKTERQHVNPTESECLSCGYVNPEQLFHITEAKTINKYGKVTNQRISAPFEWYNAFKQKIQPEIKTQIKKGLIPETNFNIPGLLKQFKIFGLRNLFIKITNRQYVILNLLEAPVLALILGFLTRYSAQQPYNYGDNKNLVAYLFMSIVVALFIGMMVSAEEIIKDRKILKREAFLNLSRLSYLNSKIIFLFFLSALQTLLYVLFGNLILEIHHLGFSYWLVLFSVSCFANMVGLNLSAGMNSVVNIYISIPFVLVPQILLSGVIVPFDTLNRSLSTQGHVPFVGDLMASRWAFEAMAVNEFKYNPYSNYFFEYDQEVANLNFNLNYWLPSIKSKIDETHWALSKKQTNKANKDLKFISNELAKLEAFAGYQTGLFNHKINEQHLNEQLRRSLQIHLDSIGDTLNKLRQGAVQNRDAFYEELVQKIGSNTIIDLKNNELNSGLEEWVKNKRSNELITEGKKGFIRKKDPIYLIPESKIGRAQFFAPIKRLGNYNMETLCFNVIAIWLMTSVLYLTLLHNTLFRLLNSVKEKKINKSRT